ncbi:50S ribosomal protein L2 [Candidatus Woesearchaeota archaeon]|nr:MAG: 50S ribosomal protein L2 [Candidatus Woesearchaeota archaeon]
MGKSLIQQKRGKGSPTYRRPSFRFKGAVGYFQGGKGVVTHLLKCQAHSAPLAAVQYEDKSYVLVVASEGVKVGDEVYIHEGDGSAPLADAAEQEAIFKAGNVLPLSLIPEGVPVHSIELRPGDGGKFCRSSGSSARIVTKSEGKIIIALPSKKRKVLDARCRAVLGVAAGGGRKDKPLLKAGAAFHKARAKNMKYPIIGGSSQNAVNHPFGNKRTSRKSHAKPAPANAPPGRKVGMIRPRRSGRKRGKQ